jgi:hypothetical protein
MEMRAKSKAFRNVDYGGGFALERTSLSMPSVIATSTKYSPQATAYYRGVYAPSLQYLFDMSQLAANRWPSLPTSLGTDYLSLWGLGSTVIAKSIPDVPEFSLFRFIGELHAGLPKIPGMIAAKERKLRNAGGEYLNFQFGLMPTISDVQKLVKVLGEPKFRAAVQRQLFEEHRVRKTIDKGKTYDHRPLGGTEFYSLSSNFSSGMSGTYSLEKEYKIWSSCSFAYYQVNALDQLLNELDAKTGGVGIVPTGIDVWNLIPWSWFVDWFTNINHVITNLSFLGKDGLYLQRGYIMAHYSEVEKTTQRREYMGTPISTTGVRTFERKYRVKASPFGFGLTWKDFDPFQLSILGALGVSRMRF